VPGERAVAVQLHRHVQRGLAAHGRQDSVRLFALEDRLDHFGRNRLDVGPVGKLRIGHDRGRVRVHQDDGVAFLAQGFAGLDAGIIELTALADHNRSRANQQDFLKLVVSGHAAAEDNPFGGESTFFVTRTRNDSARASPTFEGALFPLIKK
jgi:hypothetical protein